MEALWDNPEVRWQHERDRRSERRARGREVRTNVPDGVGREGLAGDEREYQFGLMPPPRSSGQLADRPRSAVAETRWSSHPSNDGRRLSREGQAGRIGERRAGRRVRVTVSPSAGAVVLKVPVKLAGTDVTLTVLVNPSALTLNVVAVRSTPLTKNRADRRIGFDELTGRNVGSSVPRCRPQCRSP